MAVVFCLGLGFWVSHSRAQHQETVNKNLQSTLEDASKQHRKALQEAEQEKASIESNLKQKEQENAEKQQQIESLNQQLLTKAEAKKKAAQLAVSKPATTTVNRVAPSGSCADWIAGAGIADVANAAELIRRESGCNPNAVNPSSGACGVAQELPCGKSGCALGDGACQVRWMASYVGTRYGSWANAIAHHNAKNWY